MRSTYSIQLPKPVPLTPPGFSNANSVKSKLPALARTYPHSARSQPTSLPSLPNGESRLGSAANGRASGGGLQWQTEEAAALGEKIAAYYTPAPPSEGSRSTARSSIRNPLRGRSAGRTRSADSSTQKLWGSKFVQESAADDRDANLDRKIQMHGLMESEGFCRIRINNSEQAERAWKFGLWRRALKKELEKERDSERRARERDADKFDKDRPPTLAELEGRLGTLVRGEESSRKRIFTLEQEDRAQAVSVFRYVLFRQGKEEDEREGRGRPQTRDEKTPRAESKERSGSARPSSRDGRRRSSSKDRPRSGVSGVTPRSRLHKPRDTESGMQKVKDAEIVSRTHVQRLEEQTWIQLNTAWSSTQRMLIAQLRRNQESWRRQREREREKEKLRAQMKEAEGESVQKDRVTQDDPSKALTPLKQETLRHLESKRQGLFEAEDMHRKAVHGKCDRERQEMVTSWKTNQAMLVQRQHERVAAQAAEEVRKEAKRAVEAKMEQRRLESKEREQAALGRAFESRKQGLLEAEDMSRMRSINLQHHEWVHIMGLFRTGTNFTNMKEQGLPRTPESSRTRYGVDKEGRTAQARSATHARGSEERSAVSQKAQLDRQSQRERVAETKKQMLIESEDMARLRCSNAEAEDWAYVFRRFRTELPRGSSTMRSRRSNVDERPTISNPVPSEASVRQSETKRQVLFESEDMARLRIVQREQLDHLELLRVFHVGLIAPATSDNEGRMHKASKAAPHDADAVLQETKAREQKASLDAEKLKKEKAAGENQRAVESRRQGLLESEDMRRLQISMMEGEGARVLMQEWQQLVRLVRSRPSTAVPAPATPPRPSTSSSAAQPGSRPQTSPSLSEERRRQAAEETTLAGLEHDEALTRQTLHEAERARRRQFFSSWIHSHVRTKEDSRPCSAASSYCSPSTPTRNLQSPSPRTPPASGPGSSQSARRQYTAYNSTQAASLQAAYSAALQATMEAEDCGRSEAMATESQARHRLGLSLQGSPAPSPASRPTTLTSARVATAITESEDIARMGLASQEAHRRLRMETAFGEGLREVCLRLRDRILAVEEVQRKTITRAESNHRVTTLAPELEGLPSKMRALRLAELAHAEAQDRALLEGLMEQTFQKFAERGRALRTQWLQRRLDAGTQVEEASRKAIRTTEGHEWGHLMEFFDQTRPGPSLADVLVEQHRARQMVENLEKDAIKQIFFAWIEAPKPVPPQAPPKNGKAGSATRSKQAAAPKAQTPPKPVQPQENQEKPPVRVPHQPPGCPKGAPPPRNKVYGALTPEDVLLAKDMALLQMRESVIRHCSWQTQEADRERLSWRIWSEIKENLMGLCVTTPEERLMHAIEALVGEEEVERSQSLVREDNAFTMLSFRYLLWTGVASLN